MDHPGLRDAGFFERLRSTADTPEGLFEHFERCEYDGDTYYALTSERHNVERGTVVVPEQDVIVTGYPSIPRVLTLDAGIRSFFEDQETVVLEEKLDGSNVRIARVGDDHWAFTRSGYVCPYTTWRAQDLLDLDAYFGDHPDTVLFAELIGPETPYTTHEYDHVDTNEIRVYGIRDRETGEPLPVQDRRARCDAYDLPVPQYFGTHTPTAAVDAIERAIEDLEASRREGVIAKAPDATRMVKYTTERQHHDELAYAFSLPFDYGRDFVFSRIVRDAFQAAEFDEDDARRRERARDLGESILLPMIDAIDAVESGETVGDRSTVRGPPERIDALLDHLGNQGITLEIESDRMADGERVVEFVKVSAATRDRIEYYLEGGTVDE